MLEMALDAPSNAGKHVISNIACTLPAIHKRFSLLVGPNDIVCDEVTQIHAF